MNKLKVCLIGYGYWGPKLARNFQNSNFFKLISVSDKSQSNLLKAKKDFPFIKTSKDYKKSMVLVTHNVEEAILLGSKLILLEGKPAIIKNQMDVSCSSYSDRYSKEFLALQKDLETKIEFN